MKHVWLSSKRLSVVVDVQNGEVVRAVPAVKEFVGKPIGKLICWMRRQGGLQVVASTW